MLTVRGGPPGHSLALQRGADNSQADRFLPAGRASRDEEGSGRVPGRAIACAACDGLGKCDPWTGGSPAVLGFTRGSGLGEKSSRRYGVHSELAPRSSLGGLNCWGLQSRQRAAITDIPALGRRERVCEGGRAPAKLPAPAVPPGHSRVPWQWLCGALGPGVAALLKVTNQRKSVMIFFPVL